jgi:2-C-methyl-D-erythritol 4-phosphate cytidylyltransferase
MVTADDHGAVVPAGADLWVAQTPQAFTVSVALEAHRRAAADGFVGTDTSAVVERTGQPVEVVEGHPDNIKITTSEDLVRAELIAGRLRDAADGRMPSNLTPRI